MQEVEEVLYSLLLTVPRALPFFSLYVGVNVTFPFFGTLRLLPREGSVFGELTCGKSASSLQGNVPGLVMVESYLAEDKDPLNPVPPWSLVWVRFSRQP